MFCGGANERPLVEDIFIAVVVVGFCGGGVGRSSDNGFANGGSKLRPLALRKTGDSRLRKSQSKIARRANIKTTTRRQFIKFGFAGLVRKNKQYFRHQFSAVKKTIADFLEVTLVMHNPLAVWAGGGLVDMLGEHYEGESLEVLPVFKGASKRLAEQMTEFYDFAQKTLHPAGIAQLQLDSNGSWMVFFARRRLAVFG